MANYQLRLSPLQYGLLKTFVSQPNVRVSEEDAGAYKQTTFGSMLRHQWVRYDGGGFHISKQGMKAMQDFESGDVLRKTASLRLTSYFTRTSNRRTRAA